MSDSRHLHCIGIGGIGVSALARHFLAEGWEVSGCDLSPTFSLERATVLSGHDASHLDRFHPTMVVYSPALPADHPELLRAKERDIPTYSYPQALGFLSTQFDTIGVSGTHGKSSTTALLAQMFAEGGKDPVTIVGARVPASGFEENYRKGKGQQFIVEACEYRRGMLEVHPKSAIITNIEADHLDYYKDLADVKSAFVEYVRALPADGYLLYNAEDAEAVSVSEETHARRVSFGIWKGDIHAEDMRMMPDGMTATVVFHDKVLGTIETPLVGAFNLANILAATGMALSYGIPFTEIVRAVAPFAGIGRRFEHIGTLSGTVVYSDYAHHPTALRVATEAAEAKFGKGNTLVIFQPHQIDRTKKLRTEFEDVFRTIPHLYVPEIYFVPGREHAGDFSARLLAESVNEGRAEPIMFFPSLDAMSGDILANASRYKAILFIGAGDIDRYARSLLKQASSL